MLEEGSEISKARDLYLWTLALMANILSLSPLLNSGYFGDDFHHSYVRGVIQQSNLSLFKFTYLTIDSWIHQLWRFFPLQAYWIFLFYYLNNLEVYKAFTLTLILVNLVLFGHFVKTISRSSLFAVLSVGLMPLFFQFRIFHDPILGFFCLMQILFLLTLASLIFLIKYLERKNRTYLLLSIFLYGLSLLSYEICYLFCILHLTVIYLISNKRNWASRFKIFSPYLTLSLVFLFVTALIRFHPGAPLYLAKSTEGINQTNFLLDDEQHIHSAYTPNTNLMSFSLTFLKEIYGTFPLSYYLSSPQDLFGTLRSYFETSLHLRPLGIFISLFSVFLICCIKYFRILPEARTRTATGQLLLFGILLMSLPSVLIAIIPRYQKEIFWGVSYLPVYISYFGLAMIFVAALNWLMQILREKSSKSFMVIFSILSALTVGAVGLINYKNNETVISKLNLAWLYPRSTIEEAMKNGLFKVLTDKPSLILDAHHPWDEGAFFLMHSGIKANYVGIEGAYLSDPAANSLFGNKVADTSIPHDYTIGGSLFYLRYDGSSKTSGYVILGNVSKLNLSNDKINTATAESVYVYVKSRSEPLNELSVEGNWMGKENQDLPRHFAVNRNGLHVFSFGPGWRIYLLHPNENLLDLKSLRLNFSPKDRTAKNHALSEAMN